MLIVLTVTIVLIVLVVLVVLIVLIVLAVLDVLIVLIVLVVLNVLIVPITVIYYPKITYNKLSGVSYHGTSPMRYQWNRIQSRSPSYLSQFKGICSPHILSES